MAIRAENRRIADFMLKQRNSIKTQVRPLSLQQFQHHSINDFIFLDFLIFI